MEEKEYFSLRVGRRQAEVWHKLPYRRCELLKKFEQKFKEEIEMYRDLQRLITEAPPTLVEKKQIVFEPRGGITKELLEAFFGYIAKKLEKYEGEIDKVKTEILEELNGG